MDQTTDTADLTETEKCPKCVNEVSSDSESDTEELAQDTLLGGIRSGLTTMTRTARKALSSCKNREELNDAAQRIENASLKLLKLEKSILKTASIVSDVIDDLASDYEDEDESIRPHYFDETHLASHDSSCKLVLDNCCDKAGSGDASSHTTPNVFRVTEKNIGSIMNYKEKLSKEFHKRLHSYEDSVTNEQLKKDKQFTDLLAQIKLGKKDAESLIRSNNTKAPNKVEENEDCEALSDNTAFLASLPFTAQELKDYRYKPYNEDDDMDHSVLPSIDPITKGPIHFPVRNKFCNHVFDKKSIVEYIVSNPKSTCPVHMCRNQRTLEATHFVSDTVLTSHVRRKNQLE